LQLTSAQDGPERQLKRQPFGKVLKAVDVFSRSAKENQPSPFANSSGVANTITAQADFAMITHGNLTKCQKSSDGL